MLEKTPQNAHMSITLNEVDVYVLSCFSHVLLFVTPRTVAWQAPLSMGFSKQEYWSRLLFPTQGIFPTQGSNSLLLCFMHWQVDCLPLCHLSSSINIYVYVCLYIYLYHFSNENFFQMRSTFFRWKQIWSQPCSKENLNFVLSKNKQTNKQTKPLLCFHFFIKLTKV